MYNSTEKYIHFSFRLDKNTCLGNVKGEYCGMFHYARTIYANIVVKNVYNKINALLLCHSNHNILFNIPLPFSLLTYFYK